MFLDADTDVVEEVQPMEAAIKTRARRKTVEEPPLVEPVTNGVNWDEKASRLAFNEQPVEIFLHETTNPTEEQLVFVSVNGRSKWLMRGQNHILPRCYVEVLARAKPTAVTTAETRAPDGTRTTEVRRHTALKYPFSIIRDDNPKGAEWARNLMSSRR